LAVLEIENRIFFVLKSGRLRYAENEFEAKRHLVRDTVTYNQTAYRILLLFKWLIEKPLTFAELNERFSNEPLVGKKISQDTLWLYLNTLKALGCEATRPSARNDFTYKITYHPFSYYLITSDLQVLKQTFECVDNQLGFWETVLFGQWLRKIFQNAANPDRNDLARQFFEETRLIDYDAIRHLVNPLQKHCQEEQLLYIRYLSPMKGVTDFHFLPNKLFHWKGAFYLLGQSDQKEKNCMLRVDKIVEVAPVQNSQLQQRLAEQRDQAHVYIIRFLNCSLETHEALEACEEVLLDDKHPQHLLLKIDSDNEFLLQQKLLCCGYQFQVLYPFAFKQTVQQTLEAMRQPYLA
jgi:WYL domain